MNENIRLLYVDLFCGAGGTTTGVEKATINGQKCAKVIACVNHDPNAILSHSANHPDTLHFTEDIRTLELVPLVNHVRKSKMEYPGAYVVLWASLECTNFSRAKGGQPRDADSRTLADHLFRYIDAIEPDYIQIENVEEFMCWGELDEDGKPVSRYRGSDYQRWIHQIECYGYDFHHRILNAADFGAYTSRKRFFGLFARRGLPMAFPIPTHAKNGGRDELFGEIYKKWRPVKEVLDLDDQGQSIFMREKPLCEKTLERIYAGLVKFVAGGKKRHEAFMLKYNSMNKEGHYSPPSIEEPCPTVAVQNRLGVVRMNFLSKQFSGDPMSKNQSVEQPAGAITCVDHHAMVSAKFLSEYFSGADHNHSINMPASTLTTRSRHAFVTAYFGNGYNSSIEEPNPTVTTKERHALVSTVGVGAENGLDLESPVPDGTSLDALALQTSSFIANEYSGGGQITGLDQVCPAILTTPKQKVVTAERFLMNPYSFKSDGGSVDYPCFTLIARMDKMPPYLISTEQDGVGIAIYEDDSPMTAKIKKFMAVYGIFDIRMRMLNIRELKRIMGFPEDYILVGTVAEQKKYIGNAVEVNMSKVLCEALAEKLSNYSRVSKSDTSTAVA